MTIIAADSAVRSFARQSNSAHSHFYGASSKAAWKFFALPDGYEAIEGAMPDVEWRRGARDLCEWRRGLLI